MLTARYCKLLQLNRSVHTLRIGTCEFPVSVPRFIQYVATKYTNVHETTSDMIFHMKWLAQKDALGQEDSFLVARLAPNVAD